MNFRGIHLIYNSKYTINVIYSKFNNNHKSSDNYSLSTLILTEIGHLKVDVLLLKKKKKKSKYFCSGRNDHMIKTWKQMVTLKQESPNQNVSIKGQGT